MATTVGITSMMAICSSTAAVSTSFPALAAEQRARTNWVENTITNIIEVRMSRNRLLDEYRTNWVERVTTNVFDVYRTNQLVRNVTNKFIVDAWHTNSVNVFHTNSQNVTLTNEVAVKAFQTNYAIAFKTNWHNLTVTNEVALDRIRTNVVDAFSTNWQTLYLTNWQSVVLMKTNWVTQFVTNIAQIDLPRTVSITQTAPEKAPAPTVRNSAPAAATASEDPVIEVSRTTKPAVNGLVEVELKIRWPADTTDAPPVQQWRVEREDGSFLSFAQEQECRKELPVGNYNVQARLQRDADSPSFTLKGTLSVTIKEAVVQQRTDRSKLASVLH